MHGLRVHPIANVRPFLPRQQRGHQHRGQHADTDCIIDSGGGADIGSQFWEEGGDLSLQRGDKGGPQVLG